MDKNYVHLKLTKFTKKESMYTIQNSKRILHSYVHYLQQVGLSELSTYLSLANKQKEYCYSQLTNDY